jgi:hypothetical protein
MNYLEIMPECSLAETRWISFCVTLYHKQKYISTKLINHESIYTEIAEQEYIQIDHDDDN